MPIYNVYYFNVYKNKENEERSNLSVFLLASFNFRPLNRLRILFSLYTEPNPPIVVNPKRSWKYNSESPGPTDGVSLKFRTSNARGRIAWDVWAALLHLMMPLWRVIMQKIEKIHIRICRKWAHHFMTRFTNATEVCEDMHSGSAENALASHLPLPRNMIGNKSLITNSETGFSLQRKILIRCGFRFWSFRMMKTFCYLRPRNPATFM